MSDETGQEVIARISHRASSYDGWNNQEIDWELLSNFMIAMPAIVKSGPPKHFGEAFWMRTISVLEKCGNIKLNCVL